MKFCTTLGLILLSTLVSIAQSPAIRGKVYLPNNKPAANATAILLREKDSAVVKLTVPDEAGIFEFANVKPGNYWITVSYSGYKKYISAPIQVDASNATSTLPDIQLQAQETSLSGITVVSKKPFIERKIDRLVVNVENSIISTGSTALEVLEKSPGIMVNQESGINLKGKSGVTIMIDGKPTPLSGADLITYLKSIPSSNIERIEIISSPSAKYDAQGNAGIIDIRFKKDKREGYNGNAGISIGQGVYNKPSANISLNYRKKKWNIFTTDAINAPKNFANFHINRKFFENATGPIESIFDQNTFTRQPQRSISVRTGVDFYASKKTVIGVLMAGNFYNGQRDGLSNASITKPDGSLKFTNRTSNLLNDRRYNILTNLNFKHTIDTSGKELSGDIDFGRYRVHMLQDIFSNTFDAANSPLNNSIQHSDQSNNLSIKSIKLDYTLPLSSKQKIEAGIKASEVNADNDQKFFNNVGGTLVPDVNRSNHFIYKENINAAYINYKTEFKKAEIQLGLRMENTITKGNQLTTAQIFSRTNTQFFPSAFLTQKINKQNDISLSYSRRIDRPSYRQLNPFKLLVDSYTYVTGDPYLRPVFTNSYQLGYTYKSKYNVTLTYLQSKHSITDVFEQDDVTKISTQIPANMQDFTQYDVQFNIPFSLKKLMSSNLTASFYYNDYKSPLQGGALANSLFVCDASINNSFVLGKEGWTAELNAFYQSKNAWGQFIIKNLAQVSAGIQKVSKDKKSTFKLAVADIFYTNHIAVVVKYQNQDWFTDRRWDSRFATFSYTYRFGKNTVARARQRSTGVEDEKKRAGGGQN